MVERVFMNNIKGNVVGKVKKSAVIFTALCLFLQLFIFEKTKIYAAGSTSVSVTASTVAVGGSVSATVTFSGGGEYVGAIVAEITYDASILTFVSSSNQSAVNNVGGGTIMYVPSPNGTNTSKSFSVTLNFTAKKAGSTVIKASTSDFTTVAGGSLGSSSGSKTVTVRNLSSDANLSSLSLNTGTLNPKFASGTTSYKVSVSNSVSSITVSAKASNSGAKISGTGKYNLTAGKTTTINVKVTAEDGKTTKTYQIAVTRAAATPKPSTPKPSTPKPTTPKPDTPKPTTPNTTPPVTTAPSVTETPVSEPPEASQTPEITETPSADTTMPGISEGSGAPTATPTGNTGNQGNGIFSVRAAFALCMAGMLVVGFSIGFIVCYMLKSKNKRNL